MPKIPVSIANSIAALSVKTKQPVWKGPRINGPNGGVTQSMLSDFLSCRERFRIKYILGLMPPDVWQKTMGYGTMWHECEEALAAGRHWELALRDHLDELLLKYPMQREELVKWVNVCAMQFPEYVRYWSKHEDVIYRTRLLEEHIFCVPYRLPNGFTVYLRGKMDSVDLTNTKQFVNPGIFLQENKARGDIDEAVQTRQMQCDLQTMIYSIALQHLIATDDVTGLPAQWLENRRLHPFLGVRYNIIRRPFSGGKGSIKPHAAKHIKANITKKGVVKSPERIVPAETEQELLERLRVDYIAKEPGYWFFRQQVLLLPVHLAKFRREVLDPLLMSLCDWYDVVPPSDDPFVGTEGLHWRHPFGVYNAVNEIGHTEYDAFINSGSKVGLRQTNTLFTELV